MGNSRLLIFAESEEQRAQVLKKETLNGAKIRSHIPGTTAKEKGVITGIPISVSIEEIKNSLKGGELMDAKRLTKGKEKVIAICFKIWQN